ncbi:IclR family transcriptional regulator [Ammoniphilus sp. YIM 78166]|uniref:IclR family transcriptional regulator n=1 Tax=Ammoniphilus sp. YIM 78166 TaxID=1644106 RepID=UPI00106F1212|nr:IclR family transcriptional regulator [Ammoniphilus sp. YIM 78166]
MQINPDYILSSVVNALRILRSFSAEEPEKGIRELSKSLGIGKSTVQRLMHTMAIEGFVTKVPESQKYRLGTCFLSLGTIITTNLELHREALPFMKVLVDRFSESTHIGVLDGYEVIYLHKIEASHPIRIFAHIGKYNPAHCSGCGKVLLAYKDDEFIDRFITEKGLYPYTERTITDPAAFKNHLKLVRNQGYAVGNEELGDGILSIAAPIRDYTGSVISAINVVGPKDRIKERNIPIISKELVRVANEISDNLGYFG